MARRKIVVALGGNAIQSGEATAGAQQEALEKTAEQLVKIMENRRSNREIKQLQEKNNGE